MLNAAITALRFFFGVTLERPDALAVNGHPKFPSCGH
jgi:hypothetical protein